VLPAHERLDADDPLLLERDDRLIAQPQLAALGGVADVFGERERRHRALVLALVELRPLALAAALGLVHRQVRVAEQILIRQPPVGGREADARADRERAAVDRDRLAQQREHALGRGRRLAGGRVRQQHGELVAAEPRDEIAGAQRAAQAPRHLDEQRVARQVPEAVVDRLEVVEVDEQDGDRRPAGLEHLDDGGREPGAVGEAGQRILERPPLVQAGERREQVGDAERARARARPGDQQVVVAPAFGAVEREPAGGGQGAVVRHGERLGVMHQLRDRAARVERAAEPHPAAHVQGEAAAGEDLVPPVREANDEAGDVRVVRELALDLRAAGVGVDDDRVGRDGIDAAEYVHVSSLRLGGPRLNPRPGAFTRRLHPWSVARPVQGAR
jgi:hypothetical protein